MQSTLKVKLDRFVDPSKETLSFVVTKTSTDNSASANGYKKTTATFELGPDGNTYASAVVTGLSANTQYYYWLYHTPSYEFITSSDLTGYNYLGQFRTYPSSSSSYSFSASFASCQQSESTAPIFDKITKYNPNVFIQLGDIHYWDGINEPASLGDYEYTYQTVIASSSLFTPNFFPKLTYSVPFDYIWDDHDYGPNNSDGTNPNRGHGSAAYKLVFPHYYLSSSIETYVSESVSVDHQAIYHSFNMGRVKFIVTDNRSQRKPCTDVDDDVKYVWPTEQENWFKSQITSTDCPVKVWVNSFPWEGDDTNPSYTGDDGWEKYTTYRRKIASFISDNSGSIGKLVILSGDAHMTAMDDGKTSPWYSGSRPTPPVTIFQSAPLDQGGSRKGGPYLLDGADIWVGSSISVNVSDAQYADYINNGTSSYTNTNGRYGCMEVYDDLTHITMSLYTRSGNTAITSSAGDYRFPSVNGAYKKYQLVLNTSSYISGVGGPVTQSSSFVD
jgi:phosphodiesterase/alkaline phosphatase D-like protein